MEPEAPTVNNTFTMFDTTKPATPDTVKMTTRRAGP